MVKYSIKIKLLLLVLTIVQLGLYGQSQLSLCYKANHIPIIERYNNKLDSIVSCCLGNDHLFRFVAVPSQEPEYAFQISKEDNKYWIKLIVLDNNLWYSKDRNIINTIECTKEIEAQNALLLVHTCNLFIENRIDSISMDYTEGCLYKFESLKESDMECGQIREPDPKSAIGIFCEICNLIVDSCFRGDNLYNIITDDLNQLYQKLQKKQSIQTQNSHHNENHIKTHPHGNPHCRSHHGVQRP